MSITYLPIQEQYAHKQSYCAIAIDHSVYSTIVWIQLIEQMHIFARQK